MWIILLKTWYQERPTKLQDEVYHIQFESPEEALEHIRDNYDEMLNNYPIEELTIQPYDTYLLNLQTKNKNKMDTIPSIQDMIARWKAKSPKVFAVLTWIFGILAFVAGIPTVAAPVFTQYGHNLPDFLLVFQSWWAFGLALLAAFGFKLTVATPAATEKAIEAIKANEKPEVVKEALTKEVDPNI